MTGEIPRFGLYHGEPILPPSKQKEKMTVGQLQERYPFRSRLYGEVISDSEAIGVSPEMLVRRLQMLNSLDRYITAHGGTGKARVLREKQLAVFKDTRDFLETGETEGFVEAPTGFGKTVLFSEIIKATNQKTLVVVPSRILVEQTYQALKRFNPALSIGRYYSDRTDRGKQVTVTTYQSLVISNGGVNPANIDLLILDEVHQSLTNVRIGAVGRFINPIKLGFTATPEYTRDKRVENLLNNEIHTISLKEAVETGLLCSFSAYLAETDVDLSNIEIAQDGDYNDAQLEEAINIYSRNESAVQLYKRLNEEQPNLSKAVVYCVTIKHAREVAKLFNQVGIRAEAVWSDQDSYTRRKIIEAYRKGEIKVLTNVNVLTEGFDDPEAALCLNLRPTLSKVVAKQRGGRVLRLDTGNPKKHAIVVDYLDRNENKRTAQVTFAQVAEGAQINPVVVNGHGKTQGGNGGDRKDKILVDTEKDFDLAGLHVITNSHEVLRIVSELEKLQRVSRNLERVKDTDFLLSTANLRRVFAKDRPELIPILRRVKARLEAVHPEYFAERLNRTRTIDVATAGGTAPFIKAMVDAKVSLKGEFIDSTFENFEAYEDLKETDLSLSLDSLSVIFRGGWPKVPTTAFDVKARLEKDHPEYFAQRKSRRGAGFIFLEVVTAAGQPTFFKAMDEAGVHLLDVDIPEVKETDLVLTGNSLKTIFKGNKGKLYDTAQEVRKTLEKEYLQYFTERKKGKHYYDVVTDEGRDVFIQAMIEAGIRLRD